ncbi:uncharacterized protein BBA_08581 [Beauveria bassiana ARSEF 2860]|uniref:Uncharacterized protein n=1 Tax=Beauveria bassiana (strain ARSEF 2860) TaxID=655819 RepID=J4UH95_BEAB2|nr:uncharacterized protein BBA_08581 [Beauveria bassiana ARSEF 2860]EJP62497.1 hypothetical protein BBA_08581 [Beauveria bassiana ARSEF 2860]
MSNERERQFVAFCWQFSWNFDVLRNFPTLLDTNTISKFERDAYDLLLPTQLNSDSMHDVLSTINTAALLTMCAAKPQPEEQKELLKRFIFGCKETIHEHLEHALQICDRIIEQRFDQTIQAFKSALAGEAGLEKCIELLRPDSSWDLDVSPTFLSMLKDAEKDCIPGDNAECRLSHAEALSQTAVLLSMCGKRKVETRAKLVREIVTHHQGVMNRENHQQSNQGGGDAEHWQERTRFHLEQSKSRGERLRNSEPSDIEKDMEGRKKMK